MAASIADRAVPFKLKASLTVSSISGHEMLIDWKHNCRHDLQVSPGHHGICCGDHGCYGEGAHEKVKMSSTSENPKNESVEFITSQRTKMFRVLPRQRKACYGHLSARS